jgi:hypothetical protein
MNPEGTISGDVLKKLNRVESDKEALLREIGIETSSTETALHKLREARKNLQVILGNNNNGSTAATTRRGPGLLIDEDDYIGKACTPRYSL